MKADFLYDMCREKVLTDGYMELYPTDSEPWGAVEVYQAWRNEQLQGYELCYESQRTSFAIFIISAASALIAPCINASSSLEVSA